MMNNLRLITFDVTETLLKFRIAPNIMYAKIGSEYGVCVEPEKITKHFKNNWKFMSSNHPIFGLKSIGWEKWWKEIVVRSFQGSLEGEVDVSILDRIGSHLVEIYKTPAAWETANGAKELLEYLNNRNIPLGIISNFDERLETILKAMNLHHYFKFIITSYNCGFEKPDCQIFNLALSQLGIKSCNALHVGNLPQTDYMGAINAGFNAVLIHNNSEELIKEYPNIKPEHVFQNLTDFKVYLTENKI